MASETGFCGTRRHSYLKPIKTRGGLRKTGTNWTPVHVPPAAVPCPRVRFVVTTQPVFSLGYWLPRRNTFPVPGAGGTETNTLCPATILRAGIPRRKRLTQW